MGRSVGQRRRRESRGRRGIARRGIARRGIGRLRRRLRPRRGLRGGQVIIQSFMPDHYAIEAASQHNYAQFYAEEMRYRRDQGFPPYTHLARLVYRNRNAQKAEVEARHVAAKLRNILDEQQANSTFVIGPAPCFFDRVAGEFRWHIVLRGPNPAPFLRHLSLPPGWQTEIDPLSLL